VLELPDTVLLTFAAIVVPQKITYSLPAVRLAELANTDEAVCPVEPKVSSCVGALIVAMVYASVTDATQPHFDVPLS